MRTRRLFRSGLNTALGSAPDKPERLRKGPKQISDTAPKKCTEKVPKGATRRHYTRPFALRLR